MVKWRQMETAAVLNLEEEFSPDHPLQQKIRSVTFFHNFASFQVNKCPGEMETGDIIDLGATK